MDTAEIEGILGLGELEKKILRENYFDLEDEIMELIGLYRKHEEMSRRKIDLHSRIAGHNFDIYETWMELHKVAISLSSYRAEVNLRSISLENNFSTRLNEIIEKYLLLEKFA